MSGDVVQSLATTAFDVLQSPDTRQFDEYYLNGATVMLSVTADRVRVYVSRRGVYGNATYSYSVTTPDTTVDADHVVTSATDLADFISECIGLAHEATQPKS